MDTTEVVMSTASSFLTYLNSSENKTLNDTLVRDLLHDHFLKENTFGIGLLVYLYIPVFLAGLIGNGLLILIILSRRRLRNGTNLFLSNLAFADLFGKYMHVQNPVPVLCLYFKYSRELTLSYNICGV